MSILLCVQLGFLASLEWKFPAKKSWIIDRREFAKDMFYQLGLNYLFDPIFVALATQIFIGYLGVALAKYHLHIWPTHYPLIFKIGLALLAMEFFNYWFHRAEHRFPLFWRLHITHHSPNKMGWTKQSLNHPLENIILISIGVLPSAILGAEAIELEGATLIYLVTTVFAHSNLKLNYRVISWIFVTNVYHYRHHSPKMKESHSNYGCALVLWDRIFGTFKGFESCNEVGVGAKDLSLYDELLLPFQRNPLGTLSK